MSKGTWKAKLYLIVEIGKTWVQVEHDKRLQEYRVRIVRNRLPQVEADYFTDHFDDALGTAQYMAKEMQS